MKTFSYRSIIAVLLAGAARSKDNCKQDTLDDAYINLRTFDEGKQHNINILETENFNV